MPNILGNGLVGVGLVIFAVAVADAVGVVDARFSPGVYLIFVAVSFILAWLLRSLT
ncbi:hypothetical protein C438_17165 [Haloferax denitrificans ATCC 35960]|uniref:Uncharacterized protein n=1 Tax=Haloferax denitrificans ATCC 35960 TaxID=662478 RepID=M0IU07_9EURY|nr:hypothetical protein C438_17165 [Haloferax denitrificans ATCC 35960]